MDGASLSPHEVTLVIRSPADDVDFSLRVPLHGSTVASLKERLAAEHPEHPAPDQQRLIFAGQLLRDDARAIDVLKQRDLNEPQVFHLMTPSRAPEPPTPSAAASTSGFATPDAVPGASAPAPRPAGIAAGSLSSPEHLTAAAQASFAPGMSGAGASMAAAAARVSAVPDASTVPSAFAGAPVLPASLAPSMPLQYQLMTCEWFGQPYVVSVPMLPPGYGVFADGAHGCAGSVAFTPDPMEGPCVPGRDASEAIDAAAQPEQPDEPEARAVEVAEGEEPVDALKLVLKLALFVYLLSQDGAPHRVLLLSMCAVLIFLAQTGRLDFIANLFAPALPPPLPVPLGAGVDADAPGVAEQASESWEDGALRDDGPARGGGATDRGRSGVAAISDTLVAFFTSLFPGVMPAEQPAGGAFAEQNAHGF